MKAYHWLKEDMTAGYGSEPAWTVGEERTIKGRKKLVLCEVGYHSSPTLFDALQYAPGPIACIVEVSKPVAGDKTKSVSKTRKLIAAVNVQSALGFFACDCAERALQRERDHGREPDARSWAAIETARAYWRGETDQEHLAAARAAAWAAARAAARAAAWAAARAAAWAAAWDAARAAAWAAAVDAAWAAAWAAARAAAWAAAVDAAWATARDAAWAAARAAEIQWQREHFDATVLPLLMAAEPAR